MSGPWRDRRFDPRRGELRWRESRQQRSGGPWYDHMTGMVIGYIASVLTQWSSCSSS